MTGLPYVEVRTRTQTANGAGRDNFMKNWIAGLNGNSTTSSAGACARAAVGTPADVQQRAADHLLGLRLAARHRRHHRRRRRVLLPLAGLQRLQPRRLRRRRAAALAGRRSDAAGADPGPGGHPALAEPARRCHPADRLPELERPRPAGWLRRPGDHLRPVRVRGVPVPLDAHRHRQQHLVQPERPGRQGHQPADLRLHQRPRPPAQEPPVNGCTTGNGSNAYYHRAGYAQFYLSGYSLNVTGGFPNKVKSLVSNQFPCTGGDRCISGWFLKGELTSTGHLRSAQRQRQLRHLRRRPRRLTSTTTSHPLPLLPEGHSPWVDASSPSRRQRSSR